MKFTTRARYGLRLMVELARLLRKERLVHLGRIARITGLSENYLSQLAISLKNHGLLIGVSGKNGGYHLGKPASEISINEIIRAVSGPVAATECTAHPEICMNASFCEARAVWVLISDRVSSLLEDFSLADLIDKDRFRHLKAQNPEIELHNPKIILTNKNKVSLPGCPVTSNDKREENTA